MTREELERRLKIAEDALEWIAAETGTPYARKAKEALEEIRNPPRGVGSGGVCSRR